MSGLPGKEASQDVKNTGGCGTSIIIALLILAIVLDPLGFFKETGISLLLVVGAILVLGLLGWIITSLFGKD